MTTFEFDSTGEAYDMSQCDDNIATGDTLVVAGEQVVGFAWAWPVAVTEARGALHGATDAARLMTEQPELVEGALAAVQVAQAHRYPVEAQWLAWAEARG